MIFRIILFNGFPLVTDSENDKYTDPGTLHRFYRDMEIGFPKSDLPRFPID